MLFLPVDIIADLFTKYTGTPIDQAKILTWLLIHIGCGYGYRFIKGALQRSLYGMLLGTAFSVSMFGWLDTLILYICFVAVFFGAKAYRKKAAQLIFFGGFGVLSFYHLKRMWENYGGYDMDLTFLLMQQLIRVTYFGWAIHDMDLSPEKLPVSSQGRTLKTEPDILTYLSYIFNFLGLCCPSMDYFDYTEFINQRENFESIPIKKEEHLKIVRNAVFSIGFYLVCSILLYTPQDCLLPIVTEKNVFMRVLIWNVAAIGFRSRYYVPWMISQIGLDLSGASYNKKTDKFDLYENARPVEVEWTYFDAKRRAVFWNMGVQKWLKSTFYERFEKKLGKITFLVSSFWHGFYPSYYFGFFIFHICIEVQKIIYKNQEAILGKGKRKEIIEKILDCTNCAGIFFGAALTWTNLWIALKSSWFVPFQPILLLVIFQQIVKAYKAKEGKEKAK